MSGVGFFDWSQWQPGSAARCTIGVAVPVLGASLLGHTAWGALAGLGALYAGFGSFRGVYRQRIRSIFLTMLATTLMTVIGCLVSKSTLATLTVVPFLAFVAALYATSSQLANSIATQSVCVLVVLAGLGLGPETALGNGGLILVGGFVQILLLTVIWPVNPRFPERRAIANAFLSLAVFIEQIPKGIDQVIPGTQRFEDARAVLQEARNYRWRAEHEVMVELMRSAESLRAAAVGFAQATEELSEEECVAAGILCQRLSDALRHAGSAILAGRFEELEGISAGLPEDTIPNEKLKRWYDILRARLCDLNRAAPHLLDDPFTSKEEGQGWTRLFSFLTKLPDASSLRKVALTHALRYTATLEVALIGTRIWHEGHVYWLPLTVAIVLRADFATTVTRGVSRLSGTLIGVTLATLVLLTVHPSLDLLGVLALVTTFLCFALLQVNYAIYSIAITLYVVFSVSSAGLTHPGLAWTRLVATIAGSGLALAAYVLWPAFQGRQLTQVIVDALSAQLSFGEAVKSRDTGAIDDARNHARELRLRAESLFQTAALEPWGVAAEDLAVARDSILTLDENAAELLASRADLDREEPEIERVLVSSRELRDRLVSSVA